MNKWTPFLPEEVNELTSKPKPFEDNSERQCPCCGKNSVRRYFHELKLGRTIGTSWFWCHSCHKYAHFTGGPLSQKYIFDDPLSKLDQAQTSELQNNNWYDYLDLLWKDNILPQKFKKN